MLVAALVAGQIRAANVAAAIDMTLGDGLVVSGSVNLVYSPIDDGRVSLEVNGREILTTRESGAYTWMPERPGTYVHTHIAGTNVFMRRIACPAADDAKELELGWLNGPISNLFPNVYVSVTNVVIAPTVAWLPEGAFAGCKGLGLGTGVVIRDGCVLMVNGACPESVVLPADTRLIADGAFRNCAGLTSMTIPPGVTIVGSSVFDGCQGLTEMNFQGGPPEGFGSAGLPKAVLIRYNVDYQEQWLAVLAEFGFSNVASYRPFTPSISPESGTTFDGAETLTISISLLEDGEIHYTLDGTDPTPSSPRYTKKFRIGTKTTVKAIAVFEGGWCGPIATAVYAKDVCGDPVISLEDGTIFYSSNQKVSIATPDARGVLHYTVDGSEPTKSSPVYTGEFTIDATTTIRARVLSDEYLDSKIVSATLMRAWWTVETPVIASDSTFVGAIHDVTITCPTPQSTIYYTTDGTSPTPASTVYTGSFAITTSCVIKAVATRYDWKDSAVAEKSVERKWLPVSAPVISAASSFVGSRTPVQITCPTEGVAIYYTVDGSTPGTSSKVYKGVFYVSRSCVIRAVAIRYDDTYRGEAGAEFSVAKTWTRGDSLNAPDLRFESTGDLPWVVDTKVSHDGVESLRSGAIGDNQRTEVSTTVDGSGRLSFWLKVSSEDSGGYYDYDRLEFHVDDTVLCFDGELDWTNVVLRIDSDGPHDLRWIYVKDTEESAGQDCAWLDVVSWIPDGSDPIPEIVDPTPEKIAEVLREGVDPQLVECITNESEYVAFREWSGTVKDSAGNDAGETGVMLSQNAWVSYALGSETLLEAAPTDADLTVEAFEPKSGEDGKFDFTVSVKDVEVGGAAQTEAQKERVKENLKEVFGLEGGTDLTADGMSSKNVDITFGVPEDGKVRFTAGPSAGNAGAKAFFMRVRVK